MRRNKDAPPRTSDRACEQDGRDAPGAARFTAMALVLACGNFLVVFDGLAVTAALPQLQRSLRLSASQGQWVLTAYTLTFAGLLLLGGRLGDRYGRRRVLVTGLVALPTGLPPPGKDAASNRPRVRQAAFAGPRRWHAARRLNPGGAPHRRRRHRRSTDRVYGGARSAAGAAEAGSRRSGRRRRSSP